MQGRTLLECKARLYRLLDRLRSYNLHVNPAKIELFKPEVEYVGHVMSRDGIKKSPAKIQAVVGAPRPATKAQVQQFVGLVRYYQKFIPNASSLLQPLDKLTCQGSEFTWTSECENAFQHAKLELASDRILVPFDPELPVTLATDAGPQGLGAVLSHRMPNGDERPIYYASRALTEAESHYSQIMREATAIYWGCTKFFDFIYGRHFTLIGDNKPLLQILNPDKRLPPMTANKLLRYAIFLSGFDYTLEHRKSEAHANADYFSRNPLPLPEAQIKRIDSDDAVMAETINWILCDTVTYDDIKRETASDPVLSKILKGYDQSSDIEYWVFQDIVFYGNRVCIPQALQKAMLAELHSTHIGITKMKSLARQYCYWKGIDADIEKMVKECKPCCDTRNAPAKAPMHIWEPPTAPWQRLHMDYAGPFQGHHYFILVDAYTKWAEVYTSTSAPTSTSTIRYLCDIFSRYGLPEILASDNATIFKSKEFIDFCQKNRIQQKFCAPGHPATNGQAERTVQTIKNKLKRLTDAPGTIQQKVMEILFKYRDTPLANGETPAERFFGRKIRTKLDLIRPPPVRQPTAKENSTSGHRSFAVGDRVQAKAYAKPYKWDYGTVIKKLGQLHYIIRLDNGYALKRHINQLLATKIQTTQSHLPPTLASPLLSTPSNTPAAPQTPTPQNPPLPGTPVIPPRVSPPRQLQQAPRPLPPPILRTPSHPLQEHDYFAAQPQPPIRRSQRSRKKVVKFNL